MRDARGPIRKILANEFLTRTLELWRRNTGIRSEGRVQRASQGLGGAVYS